MTNLKARASENQCIVNLYGATLFRYHHHVCRTMAGLRSERPVIPLHAPVGGADYAGGVPDAGWHHRFYRSWRGVRAATEFALLLQNWTLSVIFSAGLVAFNNDFDTQLKIWLAWYGLTSIGLVVCRSCIRIGAGWLRNHGYNKRMVAVAGI